MKKNPKVIVNVEPTYLEDHSDPSENTYLWAYKVRITNYSQSSVKLISRHWKIFDSNGSHREVKGEGVVGEEVEQDAQLEGQQRRPGHPQPVEDKQRCRPDQQLRSCLR